VLFSMLQPGRYWPLFCQLTGHQELAEDERFNTVEKLMANAPAAGELVAGIVAEKPFDEWPALLDRIGGQWATVQDAWGVANDTSLRDNGMIASFDDADGVSRHMVTNPVQFDETPAELQRGPLFAEHTDEVLRELGLTDERLIELKIAGAVT
jgi:crotonobetainyl-CoA:carnitine CoA-transferase CaiB-like acyl-CoA transferase